MLLKPRLMDPDKTKRKLEKLNNKVNIFHKAISDFIPEKDRKLKIPTAYYEDNDKRK
jgi:hypothetical protein